MKRRPISRPTEHAALRRMDRSARPLPALPAVIADLLTANRLGDREGVQLLGHLAVRVAGGVE
jgi:hypothetical protein